MRLDGKVGGSLGGSIYNEGIYAPLRKTKAAVSFALVAPEAKEKAAIVMTEKELEISRKNQILDHITYRSGKIATFEPGYWKLDGSFLLPVTPEKSRAEVGYWSFVMGDGEGYLNPNVAIRIEFSEVQDLPRVGLAFGEDHGDVAADFSVVLTDGGGKEVLRESFVGNRKGYAVTEAGAKGVGALEITVSRMAKPYRYFRLSEIDFGFVMEFDGEKLISLGLIREGDLSGRSLPVNQLRLTATQNGEFDLLNRDGYGQYLQKRQAFEYRHGVTVGNETEWVYGGAYYLDSWKTGDGKIEFTALGKAAALDNYCYYESDFGGHTVGELIRRLLKDSGFNWVIPEVLDNSPRISGFIGNVSVRRALCYLAEISCCLVYEDKYNNIVFRDVLGDESPRDCMDYENMFKRPDVKLGAYYNSINLKESAVNGEEGALGSLIETTAGGRYFTIYFDRPMLDEGSFFITPGFTVSEITWGAMYAVMKVEGNGRFELTVRGMAAKIAEFDNLYRAPWHSGREPDYPYGVGLPMFITGSGDYEDFKSWFLERKFKLLKRRLSLDGVWRQNPERGIGDRSRVEINKKGSAVYMDSVKESIEFEKGVLRGTSKMIGELAAVGEGAQ